MMYRWAGLRGQSYHPQTGRSRNDPPAHPLHEYVVATWGPNLGDEWVSGHCHATLEEALEDFNS